MFPGHSGVDQLLEIVKVLGAPTEEDMASLNDDYLKLGNWASYKFRLPRIDGASVAVSYFYGKYVYTTARLMYTRFST